MNEVDHFSFEIKQRLSEEVRKEGLWFEKEYVAEHLGLRPEEVDRESVLEHAVALFLVYRFMEDQDRSDTL